MNPKTRKRLEIGALVLVLGSVLVIAVAGGVKHAISKVNQDRVTACKKILGDLAESVNQFHLDEGKLPATLSALNDGKNSRGALYYHYHENGVRMTVRDPWGRSFVYVPRQPLVLYSIGPNGIDERGGGDDVR